MTIHFFNNSYPSSFSPNVGTYAKTISDIIIEAGFNVEKHVLINKRNKVIDYVRFYIYLFLMKYPDKKDVLYVNHYTFLIPLILRSLFVRRRTIYHWHGEELLNNTVLFKILRYLMRLTFNSDAIHIAPSNYYKEIVVNVLGIDDSKVIISPSGGVDLDLFEDHNTHLSGSKVLNIGFPAALTKQKGVNYLYELINMSHIIEQKTNKIIHYYLIDYGEDSNNVKRFITENSHNNRVSITPKRKKEEMSEFYRNIHITLFLSERESLGLTVLESMSCGVPVIARNLCSMPELVKSGVSGELVSQNPLIYEIIDKIALVSKKYEQYNSHKVASEYSRKKVIAQYQSLLSFDNH